MPTRPTDNPLAWATDATWSSGPRSGTNTKFAISGASAAQGFVGGLSLPADQLNQILNNLYQWAEYQRNVSPLFGDGVDGALSTGTLTMAQTRCYTTLEITTGLYTRGFRCFASESITLDSAIVSGAQSSDMSAGPGTTAGGAGIPTYNEINLAADGGAGGAAPGGASAAGAATSYSLGGAGGAGGNAGGGGSAGSAAGTRTTATAAQGATQPHIASSAITGHLVAGGTTAMLTGGSGGGGGGADAAAGDGGGGGAGGGVVILAAPTIVIANTGATVIHADGGAGANATGGNAGGGGGGGGGVVILVYRELIDVGSNLTVRAAGGAAGNGAGTGANGSAGSAGTIIQIQI